MQTIPAIDLLEQVWMKEKATEGLWLNQETFAYALMNFEILPALDFASSVAAVAAVTEAEPAITMKRNSRFHTLWTQKISNVYQNVLTSNNRCSWLISLRNYGNHIVLHRNLKTLWHVKWICKNQKQNGSSQKKAKAPAEEDLLVGQKDQEVASARSLKAEKFVTRQ